MTEENNWVLDENNIYRLVYPKMLNVDNVIPILTELVKDYTKHQDRVGNFLILIDGSLVEKYELNALTAAIAKVQEWMNGRVAVYNMSPYYKKLVEDYYTTHNKPLNVKYCESENEAKNWLLDENKTIGLNLE